MSAKPKLKVLLCAPRGFCAGVDRAIQIVEEALVRFGPPVYVRHEIVHNRYVVESLKAKGAVFVDELDEIPDTRQPVVFSAHGVPKRVPEAASQRNLFFLDAICPLVSKVHKEAMLHHERGREIVLIGHAGHPEVEGTMGQLPTGAVALVETLRDAIAFQPRDPLNLAWITQTTLSVDDTADIVAALRKRFPEIVGPHKEDICYATTNRQEAVKRVAPMVDRMIVVGAPNSSNSLRLCEVAERAGCPNGGADPACRRHRLERFRGEPDDRHHRRRVGARGAGRGGDRRLRRALRHLGGARAYRRGERRLQPAEVAARSGGLTWPSIPKSATRSCRRS